MRLNAKRRSQWVDMNAHDKINVLLAIGIILGILALSPSFWVMLRVI